jgi:hypothetical protein
MITLREDGGVDAGDIGDNTHLMQQSFLFTHAILMRAEMAMATTPQPAVAPPRARKDT